MNRQEVNWRVDLLMTVAFLMSMVSGLVFLIPLEWLATAEGLPTEVMGMTYRWWSNVHTVSSLLLAGTVGAHLILHARWIGSMLRRSAQRVRALPERRLEKRIARNRSYSHE